MFQKEDIPDRFSDQARWLVEIGFKKIKKVLDTAVYSVFFAKK